MPSDPALAALVVTTDVLIPVTLAHVGWVLWRARSAGPPAAAIAAPLVVALCWGALWSFVPAFAALRLLPPPGGQAGAILGLLFGLIGLLALPVVRRYFGTAELQRLVMVGPWRIVYGGLLLAIGLRGGLPEAFFWSAALGDIAVGLWACGILLYGRAISARHLAAWNLVGLLDLAHVLALGAVHLRGFFLANPDVPALNLLPLAGVPVLLALHVLTLWGMGKRGSGVWAVGSRQ